jgi:hypothetical protein
MAKQPNLTADDLYKLPGIEREALLGGKSFWSPCLGKARAFMSSLWRTLALLSSKRRSRKDAFWKPDQQIVYIVAKETLH